jgi:Ion channel
MGNRTYIAIGITFIVTPVFYIWLINTYPAISLYPWLHAAVLAIDLVIFIAIVVIFARHFLLPRSPYKTFAGFCVLGFFIFDMIIAYANIYRSFGLVDGSVAVTSFRDFLYFSIVTWTTVGYGDIKPSPDSRMFAASEALLGYLTMGLYLSLIFYSIAPHDDRR